jgi:hypothetical protein
MVRFSPVNGHHTAKELNMKKITICFAFMLICAAAVAQPEQNETPAAPVNLTTAMESTAARINVTDVVINPNPVKGQNFSLGLQNLEKGKYSVYVFNNAGKKFLLKTLNIEGGTSTETIDLPRQITTGTYILQVLSKTARFSKKMIVE